MATKRNKKKYVPSSADIDRLRRKMYPKGSFKKGTAPSNDTLRQYLILMKGKF